MTDFTYPRDLLTKLKTAWPEQANPDSGHTTELPTDRQLKRFFDVAYHASFLTEEKRRLGFRLIFTSDDNYNATPGLHASVVRNEFIALDPPREYNVGEILRLAPATDYTRVLICVGPSTSSKEKGKLCIWGLIDAGSSWWDFTHGESTGSFPPPDYLTVSSTEPGNLTISRQGWIVLSLWQGEILEPARATLNLGPIASFFASAKDCLYTDAVAELGSETYDLIGKDDNFPRTFYMQFLERILFHIREMSHGGTVIFVPHDLEAGDARLIDRILIKYPCAYDRAWNSIVKSLALLRRYYDLHFELRNTTKPISVEQYCEVTEMDSQMDEIERSLSDSIKFIASLSGVDGAVLMTDKLKVLGFGAEVIASSPSLKEIRVAQDTLGKEGRTTSIEMYGTRHRSAFRFCSSYEDAVAFVISQDGGVKAVKRDGPDLILWSSINSGALGI